MTVVKKFFGRATIKTVTVEKNYRFIFYLIKESYCPKKTSASSILSFCFGPFSLAKTTIDREAKKNSNRYFLYKNHTDLHFNSSILIVFEFLVPVKESSKSSKKI